MYLLPAIDLLDGRVVRLAKGDYDQVTTYNDDPVAQARAFEAAGATWIHVVDLDGARTGEPANAAVIERIVAETQVNVEAGGGIRSLAAVERLLDAGAARVVLGTVLVRDPAFACAAVERFGEALCAGIDAKAGEVAVAGWREGSGADALELARLVSEMGYRHLVYTDIARDGMQTGIDEQAYVRMADAFGAPVIASGGIAGIEDIERLLGVAESVEGVIAGRAVYEGALDVSQVCALIAAAGERGCA